MFAPFVMEITACWITESNDYLKNLLALYRINDLVQIQVMPYPLANERVKQCRVKIFQFRMERFSLSQVMNILHLVHKMVRPLIQVTKVLLSEIVHR